MTGCAVPDGGLSQQPACSPSIQLAPIGDDTWAFEITRVNGEYRPENVSYRVAVSGDETFVGTLATAKAPVEYSPVAAPRISPGDQIRVSGPYQSVGLDLLDAAGNLLGSSARCV